jgi:hypothetical protein
VSLQRTAASPSSLESDHAADHPPQLARAQSARAAGILGAPPPTRWASSRNSKRHWRRTASRRNNRPRERPSDSMTAIAQHETPHVGIFWVVQTSNGQARLLATACPLDQAEPYGDCLTYGPGHYETWAHWRRDRTVDPALRALVRSYEYEDWPRGRIVFDRSRDLFITYADRKLTTPSQPNFICRRGAPKSKPTFTNRAQRRRMCHRQGPLSPRGG